MAPIRERPHIFLIGEEASLKPLAHGRGKLPGVTDQNQFLATVTVRFAPGFLHPRQRGRIFRPFLPGQRRPPNARRAAGVLPARARDAADEKVPRRQPDETFHAQQAGVLRVEPIPETSGMKRTVNAIESRRQFRLGGIDTLVLLGSFNGKPEFLRCRAARPDFRRNFAVGCLDNLRMRIFYSSGFQADLAFGFPDQIAFVENDQTRPRDLLVLKIR